MKENFAKSSVKIVQCPDLTKEPFKLQAAGLGGNPKVVDLGGPPYLLPLVQRNKLYDLAQLAKRLGYEEALVIGAGAGPWPVAGTNCEVIISFTIITLI